MTIYSYLLVQKGIEVHEKVHIDQFYRAADPGLINAIKGGEERPPPPAALLILVNNDADRYRFLSFVAR